MLTADVLSYYDGSQVKVARALGIGRAAVNKWGHLVPPYQASRLHELTAGALKYDPADYIGWYSRNRSSSEAA